MMQATEPTALMTQATEHTSPICEDSTWNQVFTFLSPALNPELSQQFQ